MEKTDLNNVKFFAEYLNNLRAVNLYVTLENNFLSSNITPTLSVASNFISLPSVGTFQIVLNELNIQDCNKISPRSLDNNILCYRLIVKPDGVRGSAAAEIVCNFEKTVDEGAKNLVKNSINNVALKEGTSYKLRCTFCSNFLSSTIKFDRIRPLPSNNWVENAHELWYCHPPEHSRSDGLHQDMSVRLDKIDLKTSDKSGSNKSIVELLNNPDFNYCFYGPCNWAVNKDIVDGVSRNDNVPNSCVSRADCKHCGNELGNFTTEQCVKIWDYGVEWIDVVEGSELSAPAQNNVSPEDILIKGKAFLNFKSIVFANIYELSDHPTFRFTVSSIYKGNSIFLWNIDRNLSVYQQKTVHSKSSETIRLERCKVAKFFFAVRKDNVLKINDPREVLIIKESEENEHSILTIPDYVFRAGVEKLQEASVIYSRNEQTLQCGYLTFDV